MWILHPGMIMATKALLDVNPDPSNAAIKRALRHNLCRCTGYVRIIDAVKLAGEFLRGEKRLEDLYPDPAGAKIGVSHPRPSAMIKACGTAEFTADIAAPGALELAAVRSPHPHALIKSIDTAGLPPAMRQATGSRAAGPGAGQTEPGGDSTGGAQPDSAPQTGTGSARPVSNRHRRDPRD